MYEQVNFSQFCDRFRDMNRDNNFTYEGKHALFDYLEELEESGENIELDVIALCCEYSEYSNLAEFQENYGEDYNSISDIEEKTAVIKINDDAFIIADF